MKLTDELIDKGFIKSITIKNEQVLILITPCRFKVLQKEVMELKGKYLDNEEIGGVLQAKPTIANGEKVYMVNDVMFIRNAIEDKPMFAKDGRALKKSNAYLPDTKEFDDNRKKIFDAKCLPIFFHTHPTRGTNIFDSINNQQVQTDTSEPDREESKSIYSLEDKKNLLPRGLIVGNKDLGNDIFLGLYDGFIAPTGFKETKRKVKQENISSLGNLISSKVSSWNLTDDQKIIYGIGAALLLGGLIYKTRRFSVPVIFGLAVVGSDLLTNTATIKQPNYYNKLSVGDADINIPKEDGEYLPK